VGSEQAIYPDLLARHDATLIRKGIVFLQRSPFTSCFVVQSGSVKTFYTNERGDEHVLGFYMPGEMFGFDGVADNMYGCSAIALERSLLCRLSIRRLDEAGRERPELAYLMLKAMSQELKNAERMNRWLSQNSAEERVVGFLLDMADRRRRCKLQATYFRLAMSRSDIANYLGLALETVSRVIARLTREQLIEVHGRNIQMLQMAQLQKRVCIDDYNEVASEYRQKKGGRHAETQSRTTFE
jgi:CRP/FNR family transcriptional regulator